MYTNVNVPHRCTALITHLRQRRRIRPKEMLRTQDTVGMTTTAALSPRLCAGGQHQLPRRRRRNKTVTLAAQPRPSDRCSLSTLLSSSHSYGRGTLFRWPFSLGPTLQDECEFCGNRAKEGSSSCRAQRAPLRASRMPAGIALSYQVA